MHVIHMHRRSTRMCVITRELRDTRRVAIVYTMYRWWVRYNCDGGKKKRYKRATKTIFFAKFHLFDTLRSINKVKICNNNIARTKALFNCNVVNCKFPVFCLIKGHLISNKKVVVLAVRSALRISNFIVTGDSRRLMTCGCETCNNSFVTSHCAVLPPNAWKMSFSVCLWCNIRNISQQKKKKEEKVWKFHIR